MAIVKTTLSDTFGPVVGPGLNRQPVVLPWIVAVTTGMIDNANDEVGLVWVPKGFIPLGIVFNATDVDSGTAMVWDVGDDASEARLLSAITTGQAAGTSVALAATGLLYKYTTKTLIKAYVNTAAGTPVAGTIKGWLSGLVDEEYSTTALVAY